VSAQLSENDQVQLLLVEYKTLRTEILRRSSWQIQMWTVAVVQAVTISGFIVIYKYTYSGLFMIFLSALPFVFGLLYNDQDIRIIAAHLRTLEARINALAGIELFTWERKVGGLRPIGYRERLRRLFSRTPN
jgi:hypothetical protein